jgi:membrane fusion protein, multidrug efflux system
MAEDTTVRELSEKVDHLEDEQRRLREDQEKIRVKKPGQESGSDQHAQEQQKPAEKPKKPFALRTRRYIRRNPGRVLLGTVALALLVVGSVLLWNYLSSYESTDDAQVDGHLNMIGPRISGTVVGVYVEDNQYVKAGQVIVDLDPRDYKVALAQANAAYGEAVAQFHAESPNVPIVVTTNATTISSGQADVTVAEKAVSAAEQQYQAKLADLRNAEAQNAKAQRDVDRFRPLAAKEEISKQQFDAVQATAESQAATVDSARAAVQVALRELDERRAQLSQAQTNLQGAQENAPRQTASREATVATRQASIVSAKARVEQAVLDLSYTKIVAPVSGVVVNKTVEVGQRLQPGEDMLDISQIDDIWITANFKETQLRRMHPGQSVDVKADAFGQTFHGYLESMPGSTGARTSLLPPENATGNYVKVVQRLPVRIRLKPGENPEHRLRIGMSVEPKVWLSSNN